MPRLLLLATLLLAACDSGEPGFTGFKGLSQDASLLIGAWDLERTYFCSMGPDGGCSETTPRSTGQMETLAFVADGTVTTTSSVGGAQTTSQTTYSVDQTRITFGRSGSTAFGVSRDRLVLSTAARDGDERTYRRRR